MATHDIIQAARKALAGKDAGACESALLALNGPYDPESFSVAFEALAHSTWKARKTGARIIEGYGDAAIGPIADRLSLTSPDQLHWAMEILARLGPQATGILLKLAGASEETVRRHAAALLGRRGGREAVHGLTQLLGDPHWSVRKQSAQSLVAHPEPDAVVEAIITGLSDRHPDQLFWGVTVLFKIMGRKALAVVEKVLGTADPGVRTTVLTALATLRVEGVLPRLVEALNDPSWVVIERVTALVARFGAKATPLLLERIDAPQAGIVYAALKALLRADPAQGQSVATRLLGDPSEERRTQVVRALSEVPSPAALRTLAAAFKDTSWTVRALASDGLARAGDRAVTPVYRCLFADDPDLRHWGVRTMARLGKAGLGPLVEAYEKMGSEVRLSIVAALAAGEASDEALEVLVKALEDPYWLVRRQAAVALAAYGTRGVARVLVPALAAEGHLGHWARAALKYARPDEAVRLIDWVKDLDAPARTALLARLEGLDVHELARLVDSGPEALARLARGGSGAPAPAPARRDVPSVDNPEALIRWIRTMGAEGLELVPGAPLALVRGGRIEVLTAPVLPPSATGRFLAQVWPGHAAVLARGPATSVIDTPGLGRLRLAISAVQGNPAVRITIVPPSPPTFTQLGLDESLMRLVRPPSGITIVATPPGSGLTSILAALLARMALERSIKIAVLDTCVEIPVASRAGLVVTREVGKDVPSYAEGVEQSLAQGADALVIASVSDPASARGIVAAAAVGRHVIAGVRATGVRSAIERVCAMLGPDGPTVLSLHLRHVLAQVLLERSEGGGGGGGRGRVAAREILTINPAVAAALRQNRLDELSVMMARGGGQAEGMQSLDADLARLVAAGTVPFSVALACARDPRALSLTEVFRE